MWTEAQVRDNHNVHFGMGGRICTVACLCVLASGLQEHAAWICFSLDVLVHLVLLPGRVTAMADRNWQVWQGWGHASQSSWNERQKRSISETGCVWLIPILDEGMKLFNNYVTNNLSCLVEEGEWVEPKADCHRSIEDSKAQTLYLDILVFGNLERSHLLRLQLEHFRLW